jgi:hypothetical protein
MDMAAVGTRMQYSLSVHMEPHNLCQDHKPEISRKNYFLRSNYNFMSLNYRLSIL